MRLFQLVILVGQLFHIHLAVRDIKKKIALLFDWIAEAKAELAKPQAPDLVSLLNAYYTKRRAGAYSQKVSFISFRLLTLPFCEYAPALRLV